jgi:hypothetical protein
MDEVLSFRIIAMWTHSAPSAGIVLLSCYLAADITDPQSTFGLLVAYLLS